MFYRDKLKTSPESSIGNLDVNITYGTDDTYDTFQVLDERLACVLVSSPVHATKERK